MDWKPIETAPRDGQKVRLKGDDGKTFRGEFKEPHWWIIAPGARIADGYLFHDNGEIMRALEWQPAALTHPRIGTGRADAQRWRAYLAIPALIE